MFQEFGGGFTLLESTGNSLKIAHSLLEITIDRSLEYSDPSSNKFTSIAEATNYIKENYIFPSVSNIFINLPGSYNFTDEPPEINGDFVNGLAYVRFIHRGSTSRSIYHQSSPIIFRNFYIGLTFQYCQFDSPVEIADSGSVNTVNNKFNKSLNIHDLKNVSLSGTFNDSLFINNVLNVKIFGINTQICRDLTCDRAQFVSIEGTFNNKSTAPLYSLSNCNNLVFKNLNFGSSRLNRANNNNYSQKIFELENVSEVFFAESVIDLAKSTECKVELFNFNNCQIKGNLYLLSENTIAIRIISTLIRLSNCICFANVYRANESPKPVFKTTTSKQTFITLSNNSQYTNFRSLSAYSNYVRSNLLSPNSPTQPLANIDSTSGFAGQNYDNSISGLKAENIEGAIDELALQFEIVVSTPLSYVNGGTLNFASNWVNFNPLTDWYVMSPYAVCQQSEGGYQPVCVLNTITGLTESINADSVSIIIADKGVSAIALSTGKEFTLTPNRWRIGVRWIRRINY